MAADTFAPAATRPVKPPSALVETWDALKQNKGAVVGLVVLILVVLMAIFAPLLAPYQPYNSPALAWFDAGHPDNVGQPPAWMEGGSWQFILGTDKSGGRDVLSRLIYGARYSVGIGLTVMLVSMLIGVVVGLFVALINSVPYIGSFIDFVVMRLMDLIMSVPDLVLTIVIVIILEGQMDTIKTKIGVDWGPLNAFLETGLVPTVVAITIVFLPRYVRIVRAAAMAELTKDYVTAARVVGVKPVRLMFKTILPNCMAPLIVQATLGVSDAILQTAALGFFGMGAKSPLPEWGTMLSDVRGDLTSAPWLAIAPGLCILVTVVAINVFGDGLRDALDPKLKRG